MSRVVTIVLVCILALDCIAAQVVELTSQDFDERVLGGTSTWFVKFYAPWCGHCKKLAPVWESLATNLGDAVRVAKVDATAERELAETWGVLGFPTLLLVAERMVFDYRGKRNVDSLTEFALGGYTNTQSQPLPHDRPPSLVLQMDRDTLNISLMDVSAGPLFIKFFAPWCGHCKSLAPVWEELARTLAGDVRVAEIDATAEEALARAWGVDRFPELKLATFNKVYAYSGSRDLVEMEAFARGGFQNSSVELLLPGVPEEEDLSFWVLVAAFGFGMLFAACLYCLIGWLMSNSPASDKED